MLESLLREAQCQKHASENGHSSQQGGVQCDPNGRRPIELLSKRIDRIIQDELPDDRRSFRARKRADDDIESPTTLKERASRATREAACGTLEKIGDLYRGPEGFGKQTFFRAEEAP